MNTFIHKILYILLFISNIDIFKILNNEHREFGE
jgi:hypothetical protein